MASLDFILDCISDASEKFILFFAFLLRTKDNLWQSELLVTISEQSVENWEDSDT